MKMPLHLLTLVFLFSYGSEFVRAENYFVNWGGDYLDQEASGQILNLGGDTIISNKEGKEIGVGFAYDETLPVSPNIERYNKEKPSATFFGVLQVINPAILDESDPAGLLRRMSQVKALGRKNAIGFGSGPAKESAEASISGLVYWQKEGFLQGAEGKIPWSKLQSLSAEVASINARGGSGSVRFAVRNGKTWFLSEDEQNKKGLFIINDSSWGEWKVDSGSFPLPDPPSDFSTAGNQLTDITAVGVYFHAVSSTPGTNAVFTFNSFQAESLP